MPRTETGSPSGTGKGITPEEQEREARKEQDGKCKRQEKDITVTSSTMSLTCFMGKLSLICLTRKHRKKICANLITHFVHGQKHHVQALQQALLVYSFKIP
jgi:hypothetical protein